jgi:hypothetical protein
MDMFQVPSSPKPVFAAMALSLLAACTGRGTDEAPPAGVAQTAAAATAVPGMDAWVVFGPGLTGDYKGECREIGYENAAITIAKDGVLKAQGVEFPVSEFFVLNRSLNKGVPSYQFTSGGESLAQLSADGGTRSTEISVSKGERRLCATANLNARLDPAQPLYAQVPAVLGQARFTIDCVQIPGGQAPASATVDFAAGVVTAGEKSYKLGNFDHEGVQYAKASPFAYRAGGPSGIEIIFNEEKKLTSISLPDGQPHGTLCMRASR